MPEPLQPAPSQHSLTAAVDACSVKDRGTWWYVNLDLTVSTGVVYKQHAILWKRGPCLLQLVFNDLLPNTAGSQRAAIPQHRETASSITARENREEALLPAKPPWPRQISECNSSYIHHLAQLMFRWLPHLHGSASRPRHPHVAIAGKRRSYIGNVNDCFSA